MVLEFTKMNGAGNDFVLIDNRARKVKLSRDQVVRLCDRHRGVGADGVLLLVPSVSGKADWAWEFYNSDGSTGEMCGNGARCFSHFVQKVTGLTEGFSFETEAGVITASFQGDRVTVSLTRPTDLRLNEQVALSVGAQTIHSINTGVPHAVLFVPDADRAMVQQLGPEIRRHAHFETLACGTGVTAAALVAARLHGFTSPVKVQVQGGEQLEVSFRADNGEFAEVRLTGPAEFVFEGRIEVQ
jgi:diaminopimelate epimerase